MLKNYFKIALRNLRKHKVDSFISLSGLSIGLCCCIILIMYVRFEWSYDNFHENKNSLYRITKQTGSPGSDEIQKNTIHPYPQSIALKEELPEIASVITISSVDAEIMKGGKFLDEKMLTVSPEFLKAFSFPMVYGNPDIVLNNTDNIVLTESAAIKYFGSTNVVGETLTLRLFKEPTNYIVSGIAKDVPLNSSLQFQFLLPFENKFLSTSPDRVPMLKESWYIGFLETWITLKEGSSPKDLEAKFPEFLSRNMDKAFIKRNKIEYALQPLADVYFDTSIRSSYTQSTNKTYSLILGSIGIVILVIAGINFMCLTLSRATSRFHEIGIRKSVGAIKHQIKFQIIGEVFITCSIAILLGLLLAEILAPFASALFGKELYLNLFAYPVLWISIFGLLIFLTLITSLYPAVHISRKSATSLFSGSTSSQKVPVLVKGLIVLQFGLATTLMIGTYVMQKQIGFILNKDIGFNPENVVAIELNSQLENATEIGALFKEEASKVSGVQTASLTSGEYRDYSYSGSTNIGIAQMMSATTIASLGQGISSETVDSDYLETMGIELIAGSKFANQSNSYPSDEIIVNQAFADAMGWENPVGQIIVDKPDGGWTAPFDGKKVIGITENFNFKSLYDPLTPMALEHIEASGRNPGTILVRISSENMSGTVSKLEELWDTISKEEVFSFAFMDDMVERQYYEEIRWNRIIRISSLASILLACVGLFGLSALAAQKRVKEIGIRKVFGASVERILMLVSKDFVLLVLVGFIISTPVAWYFSNKWLANFSYKIELGFTPFLLGGLTALCIAILTVSWQAMKAATANPVDSLRNE